MLEKFDYVNCYAACNVFVFNLKIKLFCLMFIIHLPNNYFLRNKHFLSLSFVELDIETGLYHDSKLTLQIALMKRN